MTTHLSITERLTLLTDYIYQSESQSDIIIDNNTKQRAIKKTNQLFALFQEKPALLSLSDQPFYCQILVDAFMRDSQSFMANPVSRSSLLKTHLEQCLFKHSDRAFRVSPYFKAHSIPILSHAAWLLMHQNNEPSHFLETTVSSYIQHHINASIDVQEFLRHALLHLLTSCLPRILPISPLTQYLSAQKMLTLEESQRETLIVQYEQDIRWREVFLLFLDSQQSQGMEASPFLKQWAKKDATTFEKNILLHNTTPLPSLHKKRL